MEHLNNRFERLAVQQRILVVLNLGGLVLDRVNVKADTSGPREPDSIIYGYKIWNRPGKEEFLDWLFVNFDVAVWSSAIRKNVRRIVSGAFNEQQQRKLVFAWSQDECEVVPLNGAAMPNSIIKSLNRIIQAFPQYTANRIVLVDNSLDSFAQDTRLNCILPKPWTRMDELDYALTSRGSLRNFLRCLLRTQTQDTNLNVCKFIKDQPMQWFEVATQAYEQVLALASLRLHNRTLARLPKELLVRIVFEVLTGKLTF